MNRARSVRRSIVVAMIVLALATATALWMRSAADRGHVVGDSETKDGWKTISYEEVRVDIPNDWERSDMDGCEFSYERWSPAGVDPCANTGAVVAFYASATFDPAHGPGVRRADPRDVGAPDWGGWVTGGGYDVYAAADDRDVVAGILGSVQGQGSGS